MVYKPMHMVRCNAVHAIGWAANLQPAAVNVTIGVKVTAHFVVACRPGSLYKQDQSMYKPMHMCFAPRRLRSVDSLSNLKGLLWGNR